MEENLKAAQEQNNEAFTEKFTLMASNEKHIKDQLEQKIVEQESLSLLLKEKSSHCDKISLEMEAQHKRCTELAEIIEALKGSTSKISRLTETAKEAVMEQKLNETIEKQSAANSHELKQLLEESKNQQERIDILALEKQQLQSTVADMQKVIIVFT